MEIKRLFLTCLLFLSLSCAAVAGSKGVHIYNGRYANISDILYTWDGKHLYRGRYANISDILYTWDGKHLYRGRYTNISDIIMTLDASMPIGVLLAILM